MARRPIGMECSSRTKVALVGAAFVLSAMAARAEPATVLGDSIGVGISMAAGVPRLAHNSVTIRSGDAVRQIGQLPADAVAILSLGTNDAVGSIAGVEKGIDRILDVSRRAGVHLIWIGPPCVRKSWNINVQRLDAILRARLADKVTYVSVADPEICNRSLRAGDGVHFTMKGYAALWARANVAMPTSGNTRTLSDDPGRPRRLVAAAHLAPAR